MNNRFERPVEDRLSRFAAGVQEACWLGAACVIPLLVNPRAVELGYSPFKYGIWIMLSAIGIAAWIVRAVLSGSIKPSFYKNPLIIVLGLPGLSGLVSAWLSVNGPSSIWGAPETFQGIAAWLAALAMAALVGCNLRTPEQFHRLVSVIILSGFAAGLLAILQQAGLDPSHPRLLEEFRAHSTAGHAIYLAGYLLMTIPLTIWRLLEMRRLAGVSRWAVAIVGTLILLVQVIGFVCAESRGPTVGLIAMLLAYGVFLAVHSQSKRGLAALCGLCMAGGIAIGVIFFAPLPEDFGSKVPILKRFLQGKTAGAGFDVYRAEMWKHMPQMMVSDTPLPAPSGGSDRLHRLRLLVGYGPETLQSVLPQVMSSASSAKIENRFHNLVWDQLFSYGIFGTVSLLTVIFLTFRSGFRTLGWISSRRDSVVFTVTMVTSGAVGAMASGFAMSAGFIGMGVLCGIAAGAMLFAVIRALRTPANNDSQRPETFPSGLLIALLAGLVGHLVDMVFAFHTAPTAVMFWFCIGMVHAARYVQVAGPGTAPLSLAEIVSRPLAAKVPIFALGHAALLALGVVTVLFGILHQYSHPPMTFGGILQGSLLQLNPSNGQTSLLWIMPVALLLVGGPGLAAPFASDDATSFARRALRVTLLAAVMAGAFCILLTLKIRAVGSVPTPSTPMATVLKQAMAYEGLFFTYL
ncbi:MAG: O-antigen ligase family protein, partial [Luteolibacter sp.]